MAADTLGKVAQEGAAKRRFPHAGSLTQPLILIILVAAKISLENRNWDSSSNPYKVSGTALNVLYALLAEVVDMEERRRLSHWPEVAQMACARLGFEPRWPDSSPAADSQSLSLGVRGRQCLRLFWLISACGSSVL